MDNKLTQARVGGGLYLVPGTAIEKAGNNINQGSFDSTTLDSVLGNINNGRLKDIDKVQGDLFKSSRDIVLKKDNKDTSIKGILENTALNDTFFSDMNASGIQSTIRFRIYKMSGKSIDPPSSKSLYIVMRSILLQHGNFRVTDNNFINEIHKLNEHVINYCVENIGSNLQQHLGYIQELGKLPTPLDKPAYENKRNYTYDISNLL